ncbi:hypothetical protein F442_12905 [Phytophthora nicotianae P10297]|uniref:Uncharacterized protein n=2 Tax=Phytophthora nicotianae TaxID=4792 RepID=V9ER81_PHYNI|nr:hypothetical protein F443_13016 [Phytophthora nicotianae P1569]ETP39642.1 hypothetical protein F442_12905 [Phytophthora nicotianae P10297]
MSQLFLLASRRACQALAQVRRPQAPRLERRAVVRALLRR